MLNVLKKTWLLNFIKLGLLYLLYFNVSYKSTYLGIIDFPNITGESGIHTYNVSIEFIFSNAMLLSENLTNYLGNSLDIRLYIISRNKIIIF